VEYFSPEVVSRRQFLKVSTMGAVALSTVSVASVLTGCASQPIADGFRLFRDADLDVLRALFPVVMAGRLAPNDKAATEKVLHVMDDFLYGTSEAGHKQIHQLFDLLSMPFTRYTVVRLSSPWTTAGAEDIQAFLERWKNSRFDLLRGAYIALTQMMVMSWYQQHETWVSIGYVPPVVIIEEAA
jgi:hypothetical protein